MVAISEEVADCPCLGKLGGMAEMNRRNLRSRLVGLSAALAVLLMVTEMAYRTVLGADPSGLGAAPPERLTPRSAGLASAPAPLPAIPETALPPTNAAEQGPALTLDDAIRIALRSNPDLRSAEERISLADAILARARSEFYPQLSIAEDYGVTENPVNAFMFLLNQGRFSLNRNLNHPGVVDDFHTQLLVQQGVYEGGRRQAELGAAAWNREAAACALAAAQNELIFRVAEAYYRAFQTRELKAVREEAVNQVRHQLELVRSRQRAGTAVASDVSTVEVRLAEVEESLISAKNQEELAWAVLENICGAPLPTRILPAEMPPAPWATEVEQIAAAVAEAQARRPEVGQMAGQIRAAAENIRAVQSGKYPKVDFTADYDVYTPDFAVGNDSWFVGVVARLNLFDAGRTRNDVRQAEARLCELRARQQRLLLDIELSVRRTWLELNDAQQRLRVATRAVSAAEETLREIESRYRGQTATITQLVDAQVASSSAQVRRSSAAADVEIARAALEQATGRLRNVINQHQ